MRGFVRIHSSVILRQSATSYPAPGAIVCGCLSNFIMLPSADLLPCDPPFDARPMAIQIPTPLSIPQDRIFGSAERERKKIAQSSSISEQRHNNADCKGGRACVVSEWRDKGWSYSIPAETFQTAMRHATATRTLPSEASILPRY